MERAVFPDGSLGPILLPAFAEIPKEERMGLEGLNRRHLLRAEAHLTSHHQTSTSIRHQLHLTGLPAALVFVESCLSHLQ